MQLLAFLARMTLARDQPNAQAEGTQPRQLRLAPQ